MVASLDVEVQLDNGFISFFEKLDQSDERLIRLFDRSRTEAESFSTCHGKDALWVANNVYGTHTVLKYYGNKNHPSCSLKQGTMIEMLKDLLLKQNFKIEIWECDNRVWSLKAKASPGNLRQVEGLLFANSDILAAPVVAAITIVESKGNQKVVGLAFTDSSSGQTLGLAQFEDSDDFSNLESMLIQQGVKECVIAKDLASTGFEIQKIVSVIERCDLVCTRVKPGLFSSSNIVQDMNRLLETDLDFQTLPEFELTVALRSAACLISYLSLLADESSLGTYSIQKLDLNQFMKLDASAVKALNLMPGPKDGSKTTNLFGILNQCKTAQGARLLGQFIKQPLMNNAEIKKRHQVVSIFFSNAYLRVVIQETSLKAFPDLHRLAKKFQRGKSNLQDVIRIYQVVTALPLLQEHLESFDDVDNSNLISERFTSKVQEFAAKLHNLRELVETTVDLEASNNHEYKIKADFDPSLFQMKNRMNVIVEDMRKEAKRVAGDLGLEFEKKVKFENSPQYGHHLRVSRADAGKFRDESKYIVYKTVKSGALFTTKAIKKLSAEKSDLEKEYAKLQSNTVKEVIQITGTYFPVLEECNQIIAELDVFLSFATAAAKAPIPYVCPEIREIGDLVLSGSRHPCVELQDDVCFIENDATLTRDSFFSIITGPNMGGKSTFIRQIGVICLMAQIGSFVPCTSATIPIIDAVLARVGAGDSQLKGISTFMAEMLETAAILRIATNRSLIIIDELGRGTSTKDGFGLAWAIAEHIAQKLNCFTLFATHFHEITRLSVQYEGVENFHVQALVSDPDSEMKTLTLLYKVLPGVCDQSFGIHVAELAEFPDIVIQLAKRKAAELEGFDVGKDNHQHSQKRWKSSDSEIKAGKEIITRFLKEVTEKGIERLQESKERFMDEFKGSLFVQEVMQEF